MKSYSIITFLTTTMILSGCTLDRSGTGTSTFFWFTDKEVSAGSLINPYSLRAPQEYDVLNLKDNREIIAIAIAASDSHVYYWYNTGEVSSGTSVNLTKYRKFYQSNQPSNKNLIAAAIAQDDRVYYWYDDETASSGTTEDPTRYRDYYPVDIRKTISTDLGERSVLPIAIAISKVDDRVHYWYENETVSIGTTNDANRYSDNIDSNIKCENLIDAGNAPNLSS